MSKPLTYSEALALVKHFPTNNTFHLEYPRLREFIEAQQAKIEELTSRLAKPQIAAKIGGQAFQIPPHDQAPTLSSEVLAVNEILEGERDGES